ncbi:MFS transporter [Vibrio sp. S4M6]|uniref:MFS transporter n=1 Tax=Vibrio sinus TaxID=2946865 RepID=UPI00202A5068|nr:MFS transporter [Vibrio sinus]MCL9779968.1 MFS transporter [Vibrio sinus]
MNDNKSPLFLYIIILSQFAAPFMFSGVGVTLPSIGHDFNADAVSLGLIETIYLGSSAAFLLPMGKLGDMFDKKLLFKLGLGFFALCTLLIGFVPSITWMLVVRFFQGIASAAFAATSMAIITEVVPPQNRGKAFGMSIGAIYAGLASGPFISGIITQALSWHWVYWISFIPLAIATFFSSTSIHSEAVSKTSSKKAIFDYLGSVLIVVSLMLLIFGGALLSRSHVGYWLIAAGIVVAAGFVKLERHSANPLIDIRALIYNVKLRESLLIQMLIYSSAFGTTFLFSLYLQILRGYDAEIAGRILIVGSVVMACLAPFAGRLSDKYSPRVFATVGTGSILISVLLATQISNTSSLTYIIAILLFQGVGFALFSSPNMTIIMSSVDKSKTSVASAIAAKTRSLGMVMSMLVTTVVTSIMIGDGELKYHKAAFLHVMTLSFTVFAVFAGASVLLGGYSLLKRK